MEEKARAKSYTRDRSEEEVDEIERLIRWEKNHYENQADEDRDRRMSHWWSRMFYSWVNDGKSIRPFPTVDQNVVYLTNLLTEIRQRRYEEQREQELAEIESQQLEEAAQEEAERASLGEEVWSARNLAGDEAEETVEDTFGGWHGFSEIQDLLRIIIEKLIEQGTDAALSASPELRLEVWSEFWAINWMKAVAAAKGLEGKKLALVRHYDAGRQLENKYLEVDPEKMTPAETDRWERIGNEHNQRVDELKAEEAAAEVELKVMFDLDLD